MALISGWMAAVAFVLAAAVPLGVRLRSGRRAAPASRIIRAHVALGLSTSAIAFLHTILALPALGSPAATGAGPLAIAAAGLAFFLLVAHAGLGLRLRDEALRARAAIRRRHAMTAAGIAIAVGLHVLTLEIARR